MPQVDNSQQPICNTLYPVLRKLWNIIRTLFWHLTNKNNILFILLLASQSVSAHKYYVSTTQINIRQDTLHISIGVFIDDFENALAVLYGTFPMICSEDINKKHEADSLVFRYFKEHFFINSDSTSISCKNLKTHCTDDTFFMESTAILPKSVKNFTLTNKILISLFAEQRNIIQVNTQTSKRCVLLSKGHETEVFTSD